MDENFELYMVEMKKVETQIVLTDLYWVILEVTGRMTPISYAVAFTLR